MPDETNIHTAGGASVSGDVNTGNDFIARDKNVIYNLFIVGCGGLLPKDIRNWALMQTP
jgi:hypothetical protein